MALGAHTLYPNYYSQLHKDYGEKNRQDVFREEDDAELAAFRRKQAAREKEEEPQQPVAGGGGGGAAGGDNDDALAAIVPGDMYKPKPLERIPKAKAVSQCRSHQQKDAEYGVAQSKEQRKAALINTWQDLISSAPVAPPATVTADPTTQDEPMDQSNDVTSANVSTNEEEKRTEPTTTTRRRSSRQRASPRGDPSPKKKRVPRRSTRTRKGRPTTRSQKKRQLAKEPATTASTPVSQLEELGGPGVLMSHPVATQASPTKKPRNILSEIGNV